MASSSRTISPDPAAHREHALELALGSVKEALGRLRYGAIQLVVHDGRLVQIEVTERQRFA